MKSTFIALIIAAFFGMSGVTRAADAPTTRPNIIFILADDLGLDGVSVYGADKHQTPNIDALAASGIRFQTAYAAPLCGPSRCLLMTGRYAFRTGGITNESWRNEGPGAKSTDEFPIAKLLKQSGYATGQAGKWRQVGELPGDWGFDEFITDNTAGGWYWQTKFNKNGATVDLPEGSYGPDVVQNFTYDFIERHKDQSFFFYYANHLVHKPTLRTPDTAANTMEVQKLYDDNIKYMDKQVGGLVAKLEKLGLRQNTLIVFAGDNGTAVGYPSPIKGRMINGAKGSMLEGGSHIPFIASWPAITPAGKVVNDLVSFADPYATFAELAGAKIPDNFATDGKSFAPQLRGETGTPRDIAYVQLGERWFVRDAGYKLNEQAELFDLSDAPFVEKPIAASDDTAATKAERQRLTAALAQLDPSAGKQDSGQRAGGKRRRNRLAAGPTTRAAGPWSSGDSLPGDESPEVAERPLRISADVDASGADGVILTQGGAANGYALLIKGGKLSFAVREASVLTTISATEPLGKGQFRVEATLSQQGALELLVNDTPVANGKAGGPIPQQPRAGLTVGSAGNNPVADFPSKHTFDGKVTHVHVTAAATN